MGELRTADTVASCLPVGFGVGVDDDVLLGLQAREGDETRGDIINLGAEGGVRYPFVLAQVQLLDLAAVAVLLNVHLHRGAGNKCKKE